MASVMSTLLLMVAILSNNATLAIDFTSFFNLRPIFFLQLGYSCVQMDLLPLFCLAINILMRDFPWKFENVYYCLQYSVSVLLEVLENVHSIRVIKHAVSQIKQSAQKQPFKL